MHMNPQDLGILPSTVTTLVAHVSPRCVNAERTPSGLSNDSETSEGTMETSDVEERGQEMNILLAELESAKKEILQLKTMLSNSSSK